MVFLILSASISFFVRRNMIKVDQQYFELIEEYRECFDEEIFSARYSDILDKYDYVVGDYGYDQLRLKGFYKDSNKRQK